eukprot:Nitzschia sp. Nitz4//scaffold179_size51476//38049//39828//NITZ4_006930-RA/size51476-augustus-gene-0.3-mRNA-1//-1//CDS//3329539228//8851//frame0
MLRFRPVLTNAAFLRPRSAWLQTPPRSPAAYSLSRRAASTLYSTHTDATSDETEVPNFENAQAVYESKSTYELLRAIAVFRSCQIPILVENSEGLLNAANKVFGTTLTGWVLKSTLFPQFCAGTDRKSMEPALKRLEALGVGCILDYAAEDGDTDTPVPTVTNHDLRPTARQYDYEGEAQCDRHVKIFETCIRDAASLSSDSFAAVKVTALGNPTLLARMSTAIVESQRLFHKFDADQDGFVGREEFEEGCNLYFNPEDFCLKEMFATYDPDNTGKIDYITWALNVNPVDLPMIVKSCKAVGPLSLATPTEEEVELIQAMYDRAHKLADIASETGTRLLVDAEQAKYQPAIDSLVLDLQQKYNNVEVSDIPIIYNTYQCYLKDTPERLQRDVERANRFNYHFGAKLVRGAYMERENAIALALGLESPILETKEETDAAYDDAVDYLLKESTTSDHRVELMCATHNQESMEKAMKSMVDLGMERSSDVVSFAQLYGMSDHLTLSLGQWGYRAYKYVPYGKVQEVIPYLLRRAKENSSMVGGAATEIAMMEREVGRRVRSVFGS